MDNIDIHGLIESNILNLNDVFYSCCWEHIDNIYVSDSIIIVLEEAVAFGLVGYRWVENSPEYYNIGDITLYKQAAIDSGLAFLTKRIKDTPVEW